ncbi:MAG: hypothetical protein NTY77_08185 [Elusimicrobia bacterium]|nr:hypothetical protein [Elusimicrobiota bacterium]
MDPETKAWCLFCAAVFLGMGGNLFLGAPEHAGAALAWMAGEGTVEPGRRRRLSIFYRLGGAVFAGFGLWLLWSLWRAPAALAILLPRQRLTPLGRALGGLFFLGCGSLWLALRTAESLRSDRRPRTWDAELGPDAGPEGFAARIGRGTAWLMALVFLAFGAYLIRGAAR